MSRSLLPRLAAASCLLLATATSSHAVLLQRVAELDGFELGTGNPGSVAAYGDTVYVGSLFAGGTITKIDDPLGAPVATGVGPVDMIPVPPSPLVPTTNGFVSLSTDGQTVVAATNNGGGDPDFLEAYNFATGAQLFSTDSATLGVIGSSNADRFDGAAVDPVSGNIWITAFGITGAQPVIIDPSGAAVAPPASPTNLFVAGINSGFRDISFDNATGDIYVRTVDGVSAGERVGPFDLAQPDGGGAGVDPVFALNDGFNSAINVEYLPASFTGADPLVIANFRNLPNTFAEQVLVVAADGSGQVPATFLDIDGSAFTPDSAGSGIYDFSFDPVNSLLYVADFSEGVVHVFTVVPEPSSFALLALAAGLVAGRRK